MSTAIPIDELKEFLEIKVEKFNRPEFIADDPVLIPHLFSKKEDIEIAGFLVATISWGKRISIIKNGKELVRRMDFAPSEFIGNASAEDFKSFEKFVHRTFNGSDCVYFLKSLQNIYNNYRGLENVFTGAFKKGRIIKDAISGFREIFFELQPAGHALKHVADPLKNASAKRLNMFLRWMVRHDGRGFDFGLWQGINQSELCLPLDVHTGNISRKLGLLNRNTNDWRAVEEVTANLKEFDPQDPVKYDFALFGLGIYEKF